MFEIREQNLSLIPKTKQNKKSTKTPLRWRVWEMVLTQIDEEGKIEFMSVPESFP